MVNDQRAVCTVDSFIILPETSNLWVPGGVRLGEFAYSKLHPSLQLLQITAFVVQGIISQLTFS